MLLLLYGITFFLLGVTCNNIFQSNAKLFQILLEAVITKLTTSRLRIENSEIHNTEIVKYGDLYLTVFKMHHYYDIQCFEKVPVKNESHCFNINAIKNTLKNIPLNMFMFKNNLCYTPTSPKSLNYKHFYVCIRRINFQDYSVYRIEENEYLDFKDLIEKYETFLSMSRETTLAEAYD